MTLAMAYVVGLSVLGVLAVAGYFLIPRLRLPSRDNGPVPPVVIPPPPARHHTPEEDRAQLIEFIAWGLLQRHAPDLSPAEAFEKAEAWQRIMEDRESTRAGNRGLPPAAAP